MMQTPNGTNLWAKTMPFADLQRDEDSCESQPTDLLGSSFAGSNLVHSNFTGATLIGADFSSSCLFAADLRGADLYKADFTGAITHARKDARNNPLRD